MGKKSKKPKKPQQQLLAVYDPGDEFGFLYSHGNGREKPAFIALNVPLSKQDDVAGTMNFLENRAIEHGQSVQSNGLDLLTNIVEGNRKAELLRTHAVRTDSSVSKLVELIPRFHYEEGSSPETWGSRPLAPEGREELVDSILDVWRKQQYFLCFKDGIKANCRPDNLKRVDLAVALQNADDWVVDWDMELTREQSTFVRAHPDYFSGITKVIFRASNQMCSSCLKIDIYDSCRLRHCAGCEQTWYCDRECQRAHWKKGHKKHCAEMADWLNKN